VSACNTATRVTWRRLCRTFINNESSTSTWSQPTSSSLTLIAVNWPTSAARSVYRHPATTTPWRRRPFDGLDLRRSTGRSPIVLRSCCAAVWWRRPPTSTLSGSLCGRCGVVRRRTQVETGTPLSSPSSLTTTDPTRHRRRVDVVHRRAVCRPPSPTCRPAPPTSATGTCSTAAGTLTQALDRVPQS